MSILQDIRDYLESKADVRDAFSHPKHGFRCYAGRVPQGVPNPCMTLEVIRNDPRYLLGNESTCLETTIQVTVYADKEHLAASLLETIRLAPLSAYRGLMGNTQIVGTRIDSERITVTPPVPGSDQWDYQGSADYAINYHRAQPVLS